MKRILNFSMIVIILVLSIVIIYQHIEIKKQIYMRDLSAECYWNAEELKMQVEDELWNLKSITK